MATAVVETHSHQVGLQVGIQAGLTSPKLSWLERYVLKRAHPRGICADLLCGMWTVYFLWNQNWEMAMVSFVLFRMLGILLVVDVNPERLIDTTLGRLALLNLHPLNFSVQLVGAGLLVAGIWSHSAELILGALSLSVLGHLFGWPRVNSRFARVDERGGE